MSLATWTIWPEAIESVETCNYSGAFSADGSLFAALSAANTSCEYFGTPGIFTAPWWPVKLVVASSLTLCGIIFLFKTILGDKPTGKTS